MIDEIDKLGRLLPGRPVLRPPGGARSRAERGLPRPLPRPALRHLAHPLHHHGQHPRHASRPPARPHGGDPPLGLHRQEKMAIAQRYLIPPALERAGLPKARRRYDARRPARPSPTATRARRGCATSRRPWTGSTARWPARACWARSTLPLALKKADLEEYLGKPVFLDERARPRPRSPAWQSGLAWTPLGGAVLDHRGRRQPRARRASGSRASSAR